MVRGEITTGGVKKYPSTGGASYRNDRGRDIFNKKYPFRNKGEEKLWQEEHDCRGSYPSSDSG
jgi:hypothetical protein